jgi:hypothetical protein
MELTVKISSFHLWSNKLHLALRLMNFISERFPKMFNTWIVVYYIYKVHNKICPTDILRKFLFIVTFPNLDSQYVERGWEVEGI